MFVLSPFCRLDRFKRISHLPFGQRRAQPRHTGLRWEQTSPGLVQAASVTRIIFVFSSLQHLQKNPNKAPPKLLSSICFFVTVLIRLTTLLLVCFLIKYLQMRYLSGFANCTCRLKRQFSAAKWLFTGYFQTSPTILFEPEASQGNFSGVSLWRLLRSLPCLHSSLFSDLWHCLCLGSEFKRRIPSPLKQARRAQCAHWIFN